jgi:hypothetical protein
MGEGVRVDRPAVELAEDALAVTGCTGVDQDGAGEVDVDGVAWPAAELEEVVGDLVDGRSLRADPIPVRPVAASTVASRGSI